MLIRLFEHLIWADGQSRLALVAMPADAPQRERALGIAAHLAAAEHIWLARLRGDAPAQPVWPALSLEQAAALAAESAAGLLAFVRTLGPEQLAAAIAYRNSAGQEFHNRTEDVLAHVALHGSYHRGQLALLARDAGATPAATDYVVFLRGVPAPAQAPPA